MGAAAHVSASANDCAHVCAPGEPLRVERRHAANARIGAPAAPSRAAGPAAHGDARLDDACISARHPAFRGPRTHDDAARKLLAIVLAVVERKHSDLAIEIHAVGHADLALIASYEPEQHNEGRIAGSLCVR